MPTCRLRAYSSPSRTRIPALPFCHLALRAKKPLLCKEVESRSKTETVKVYRSLQKLVRAGLCNKIRKPLKGGGHFMVYEAVSYDNARESLEAKVNQWYKTTKNIISNR